MADTYRIKLAKRLLKGFSEEKSKAYLEYDNRTLVELLANDTERGLLHGLLNKMNAPLKTPGGVLYNQYGRLKHWLVKHKLGWVDNLPLVMDEQLEKETTKKK